MKAEELAIEDWVMYNGRHGRVSGISPMYLVHLRNDK